MATVFGSYYPSSWVFVVVNRRFTTVVNFTAVMPRCVVLVALRLCAHTLVLGGLVLSVSAIS